MKFFALYFLSAFCYINAACQDTSILIPKVDINNNSWNVRINNGIQSSYFFDFGLSRTSFIGSGHGFYGTSLSISYSLFPNFKDFKRTIQGVKLSGEFFGNMFGIGLDLSYYNSNQNSDFFIAPKALLGISKLNFYYSYNFSTNNYHFTMIGKHAFGVSFHLPFYWNDKIKKEKRWGFKSAF